MTRHTREPIEEGSVDVGWHYTSLANWSSIQEKGLVPYICARTGGVKDNVARSFHRDVIWGVWILLEENLTPRDEFGSVLWQVSSKDTLHVVRLRVDITGLPWVKHAHGFSTAVSHHGNIEKFLYHQNNPRMAPLEGPIPPERITLERTFDLAEFVWQPLVNSPASPQRVPYELVGSKINEGTAFDEHQELRAWCRQQDEQPL